MKFFSLTAAASLSIVLSSGAIAQSIDTTATPITLAEAIKLAQQNSVTTVQARGTIRTSEAAVKQSYAAFLPSFSVSANRQKQSGDRFDTQGNLYVAASLGGKRGIVKIAPDKGASLAIAGQGLVGLAFTRTGGAVLVTTNAVFHLTWGVQGLPLI